MLIISIGRGSNNKIIISDAGNAVSSSHGEIKILDNGSMYYRDISKNGTMVNGKIIHNTECLVQRGTPIVFPNNSKLDWNQVSFPSQLPNVKKEISIGKNPDNKIHITGERISRYHAILKITADGKYFLFDQSTNGTSVNGNKIPGYADYKVKRNDKIFFANSQQLDWKLVPRAGIKRIYYTLPLMFLLLGAGSYVMYKVIWGQVNISNKYNKSVCLVYNSYYLAYLDGEDTLYYIGQNGIVDFKNKHSELSELKPMAMTGSGFFVSETGKIITNKHVAAPWESELAIDKELIQKKIGLIDATYNEERRFNPKIVGVPAKVGVFLNESDMDKNEPFKNLVECDFIRSSPEKEIDLALLQTKGKSLPAKSSFIESTDIILDKAEIKVDDDIIIIGFPLGLDLALKNTEGKIKSTSNHGRISKISDKYEIQYDAGSTHGASGSPVFNKEGKLIAVNYAGVEIREGFNFGIIATYIRNIISD